MNFSCDLFLTNDNECILQQASAPLVPVDTWHVPFEVDFSIADNQGTACPQATAFSYVKGNYLGLYKFLANTDWSVITSGKDDVDKQVLMLTDLVTTAMKMFIPAYEHGVTNHYPSWFSHELKHTMRKKLRYHRHYKQTNNLFWYEKFKSERALAKRLYRRDHRSHTQSVESSLKQNPQSLWKYTKNFSNKKKTVQKITLSKGSEHISSPSDVCQAFADFFSAVFDSTGSMSQTCTLPDQENVYLSIPELSIDDVFAAIRALPPKKSAGADGIPLFIVKGCGDVLAPILTFIFNRSLKDRLFPTAWKFSLVVPIFKDGSALSVSNYRPISLICSFAKVFEKAMHCHIMHFFSRRINVQQHGFMPNRSVETNLIAFTEFVGAKLGSKQQVDAIYFDFKKAFDLVSHPLLVKKLVSYGISLPLCEWIQSYLHDRWNSVSYGGAQSTAYLSRSGVPQGSSLSPLLFNIFVNDICSCINHSEMLQFADDVKLFRAIVNISECDKLQQDITALADWCKDNNLVLNPAKTKVISFSRKHFFNTFDYTLNNCSIERVSVVRDLGVFLDSEFKFSDHVAYLSNTCYRTLGAITRMTRNFRGYSCLLYLYRSLILSKLDFSSVVWNRLNQTNSNELENVQRKFVRLLYNRYFNRRIYFSHERLLKILNLHCLSERRQARDFLFLHKCLHGIIDCPKLTSSVFIAVPGRSLRSHRVFGSSEPKSLRPIERIQYNFNMSNVANTPEVDIFLRERFGMPSLLMLL